LSPDAIFLDRDKIGHGTAEAANVFSNAPDVNFLGIKMGMNITLAFKIAVELNPTIITNSWGYDLAGISDLPNFLRPLEAAVKEAVLVRGITVCFSAGNGETAFPAMMPEVIACGGVFVRESVSGSQFGDFDSEASNFASSFDSVIYPGRHVPDVCGLVGTGDLMDAGFAGGSYPDGDETTATDGWAVISGTSAAAPQVAGICALLKQAQPGLSPALIKSVLRASARQVSIGRSNVTGGITVPAGSGQNGATGAGLADAQAAYRFARSVMVRSRIDADSGLATRLGMGAY
jgi:subtilisin family serine protease